MCDTNLQYVVVGLGITGLSCVRFLMRRGVPVRVIDTRPEPPFLNQLRAQFPDVPIACGGWNRSWLEQADTIILSPGLSLKESAIVAQLQRGATVYGDIDLFARHVTGKVIAITGTNGKSTLVALLSAMAQVAGINAVAGGNIGVPALDLLEHKADYYILELSSFQLETTTHLHPLASVVLNLAPDHLERYDFDLTRYASAKQRIYHHSTHCIVNRDDPFVRNMLTSPDYSFGSDAPHSPKQFGLVQQSGKTWLAHHQHQLLAVDELLLQGKHHWQNALAACALATCMGIPLTAMQQALQNFPGLPHRCQLVHHHNDIAWYNDSKATNVAASQAVIDSIGSLTRGKLVLIMGGEAKETDFSPLRPLISQHARCILLIGRDKALLKHALQDTVPCILLPNLEQAIHIAKQWSQPGDAVLLAPACTSFDQFTNFEQRGEHFIRYL